MATESSSTRALPHDENNLTADRARQSPVATSGPLPPPPAPAPSGKKSKAKKAPDSINTSKQIEDTIAALERNKAGDKEQELEIERDVKKAGREISNQVATYNDPIRKIDFLQKKCTELLYDMKRHEREHVKQRKRTDQLQKDKDSSRSELTKTTAVKDKLEKLCRELQRDNKKFQDENKRIQDTETAMREQLNDKLESMTSDVQHFIHVKERPEDLPETMDSDELFRQKFKSFIDQYELRELQFHSVLRTKELEVQYQMARYEQLRKAQEQEANKSRQLSSQVSTFSQTETELRSQLNIYVEKFKQVEDTLNNSNDLFLTFRKEMEEMSKKTKRLEKENHSLTRKHELTSQNILQMAEERSKSNKEMDSLRKKNESLARLCRGMQAQGRGQGAGIGDLEADEEGTESDYDDEYEEDDDCEEEEAASAALQPENRQFGPVPPPPATSNHHSSEASSTSRLNGALNGVVSH